MKISVVLPVYNGAPYLAQAIDSILRQELSDFELLLLDDCSKDDSAEIIARYAAQDARVRPIYHTSNLGLAGTLNEGLRLARGEYVARLDQDDEALPQRLRLQADFLDAHPETLVVGGHYFNMGANPALDRRCELPTSPNDIAALLPRENCVCHPAVMMRRQAVIDVGGYREEFRNAEDYDLWLRLSCCGEIANLDQPVIRYRLTTSGMSYSRRWEQLRFVFLAQESHGTPDQPITSLWPRVEQRLAALDRTYFFDCVARHAVKELHALGFPEDAHRMLKGFEGELSHRCRTELQILLEPISTLSTEKSASLAPSPRNSVFSWLHRLGGAGQALLAATLFLLPSLVWIARDQTVWPWDQAWYGEVAVDLWWTAGHQTEQWGPLMLAAFGIKAPGLSWLGQFFVPVGAALGSVEFALLVSVLATQAAALVLQFQIGTRLWLGDHRGGWLAVAWMSAAPLFVALSHQFLVEPLQLFAVTYIFWIAIAGDSRSRIWFLGHAVMAAAVAMVAKATSPLYVIFPAAIIIYRFIRAQRWVSAAAGFPRLAEFAWFSLAIGFMALTARWYWQNQQTLREFVQLASSSEVALDYGQRPEFWTKWGYWLLAFIKSFFTPVSAVGLLLIAASTLFSFFRPTHSPKLSPQVKAIMVAGAAQLVLVLAVFTRQINEENRYLLPLIVASLCVVVPLLRQAHPAWSFRLGMALAVAQWGWVHAIGAGLVAWSPHASYWLRPAKPDRAQKAEIENVIAATTDPQGAYRYHVNGYEADWLNANSLAFYAAKHRLKSGIRCYYTSLGYAAKDIEPAWQRMESLRPLTFISLKADQQPQPPNFVNQISLPFLERVRTSGNFRPVPFKSSRGIVIYEHIPETR